MSWATEPLQNVATFTLGKMLDAEKNRGEFRPYLANVNVRWGEFELSDLREMRFQETELDRFGLKYGDIVMCEGGEPGRCAIWKEQLPAMMVQKALHRIRAGEKLDYRFLYYVFLFQGRIGAFSGLFTGATIKHLPKDKLAQIRVPVPPLPTQRRIADILSAYDDLIENNTRRIAILEDMARRLFEEWFNRPLTQGLPTGWAVAPLRNILKLHYGKALKADTRIEGAVPVYGSSGAVGSHNVALVNGPGIILGRKGNVGSVFYSHCDFYPIDTVFYVETEVSLHFIYQTLRQQSFTNSDSAVPGLNRDLALSKEVAVPPSDLIERYDEWASPVMAQAELLRAANTNLRTTRDLLLPKLISGEIEVRAAEEELEAVAA